jgi:hypothetical protein
MAERILAALTLTLIVGGIAIGFRNPSQVVITAPEPWRQIPIIRSLVNDGGTHAP